MANVDHYKRAEEHIALAENAFDDNSEDCERYTAMAAVHAALAHTDLVERIAVMRGQL